MDKGDLDRLNKTIANVGEDGVWNYDPYMQGLANGLILARSIMTGEHAAFFQPPKEWGKDKAEKEVVNG